MGVYAQKEGTRRPLTENTRELYVRPGVWNPHPKTFSATGLSEYLPHLDS